LAHSASAAMQVALTKTVAAGARCAFPRSTGAGPPLRGAMPPGSLLRKQPGIAAFRPPGAVMNYVRIFHVPVLVALGAVVAGCGQQNNQPSARLTASIAAGGQKSDTEFVRSRGARTAEERLDVYIGEVFANEQKALSVKDAESNAPSF